MRILVSNDDGIYSPGIAALAEVASEFGTVRIVAPDVERSSTGHAITASRPLSYRQTKHRQPQGLPRQRHAGRLRRARRAPLGEGRRRAVRPEPGPQPGQLDLALGHAGGGQAGRAARAARHRAQRAGRHEPDFEPFKPWIRQVLETLLPDDPLPLVNVNFPREPRGLIWTRVSVRHYDGRIVPTKDPMGRELYWFTVKPIESAEEGTDRWALEQGWISLTPLCARPHRRAQLSATRARAPARRGGRPRHLAAEVVARGGQDGARGRGGAVSRSARACRLSRRCGKDGASLLLEALACPQWPYRRLSPSSRLDGTSRRWYPVRACHSTL